MGLIVFRNAVSTCAKFAAANSTVPRSVIATQPLEQLGSSHASSHVLYEDFRFACMSLQLRAAALGGSLYDR